MKRSTRNRADKRNRHRREILTRLVFSKFYGWGKLNFEESMNVLRPYRGEIAAELAYLKEETRSLGWDTDNRKGEETYGYADEESILVNLHYISDRFTAEFRLQWVLDLIDREKITPA